MTGRRISAWGVVALAAASAVLAGIVVLDVDAGSAQGVSASPETSASPGVPASPETSAPALRVPAAVHLAASTGTVSVTSDRPLPARFASFSPGSSERWRVTATVSSTADLSLQLAGTGVLATRPDGLVVAVAVCGATWSDDGTCPTTSSPSSRHDR